MKNLLLRYRGIAGISTAEVGVLGVTKIKKEKDGNGSFVGYRITHENGSQRIVFEIVELYTSVVF
jgi:hypothetical protein